MFKLNNKKGAIRILSLFAFIGKEVEKMKIEEICIESKDYPQQLKNIYDPPLKLYVLGNRELLKQKGIAIVGARKATEYGKKVAFQIAKKLSEKGINIISGLAIRSRFFCTFRKFTSQK